MPDPFQPTIKRRREERVHLIYEVETLGQIQQVELPYIVGVMANLSGDPNPDLPPLRERQFEEIDQKGFDAILAGAAPSLAFSVPNRLTGGDTKLPVDLHFKLFEDFEPDRVAEQIPVLKALLEERTQLKELLGRMPGKPGFREALEQILANAERRLALAGELGVQPPAAAPEAPPTEGPT
jgi:type VI secretion system protein ImpB